MAMSAPKALIVSTCSSERRSGLLIGASARELLCVGNVPIVFHVLSAVRRAGITDAVLAVDPACAEAIRSTVGAGRRWDMRVSYVECDRPGDTTSAVLAAEGLLDGSPFLVHPGDGILARPLAPFVEEFLRSHLDGLAITAVERSGRRRRRVVAAQHERGEDGAVSAHSALTRVAVFSDSVLDCLRGLPAAVGRDLAEPVERLRERGKLVEERESDRWWRYHGHAESLLDGNRLVLDELEAGDVPDGVVGSEIDGRVTIHPTAVVRSSVVRGPAVIGAGAELLNAYIGPYTSVGDRVVVEGAEVADSILLPGGLIRHVSERIERSVLGRDAKLIRDFTIPRAARLVVGDGTEIALT